MAERRQYSKIHTTKVYLLFPLYKSRDSYSKKRSTGVDALKEIQTPISGLLGKIRPFGRWGVCPFRSTRRLL